MDRSGTLRIGDNSAAAQESDESLLTKLNREAQVLLGGTLDGVRQGAEDAYRDPWNTGLKLAGSVAVGLGLAYMQRGAGVAKLAAEALGVGMGIAFMTDVVSPGRLDNVGGAVRDTWSSPKHLEHNRSVIGQNLGRFAFDTGLMMAGGLAGAMGGKRVFSPKLSPLSERPGQLFNTTSSERFGTSAGLEARLSELPASRRLSSPGESEFIVQATDPPAPSSRRGARWDSAPARSMETFREPDSVRLASDTRAGTPLVQSRVPEALPPDIPARDVLARWDVRELGDPALLSARRITKGLGGRIETTTNAYGEVTEFAYGPSGFYMELKSVKFPDGTVARHFRGDHWFIESPGQRTSEFFGRIILHDDGTLIKLPRSGGGESIFLNGMREISLAETGEKRILDRHGRTLKTGGIRHGKLTAFEYDGGTTPVRTFESHEGIVTEVTPNTGGV